MVELKQQVILEVKKNDRSYALILASDAPLGEVFDAITEMRSYVVNRFNEVNKIDEQEKSNG